jgi:hypothetical protein
VPFFGELFVAGFGELSVGGGIVIGSAAASM